MLTPIAGDLTYTYNNAILSDINNTIIYMTSRHCKVYVVRIDVRFPLGNIYPETNEQFSKLMARLAEQHRYHKIEVKNKWVREKNASENHHYHIALFMDGSKVQNGWSVRGKMGKIWSNILNEDCDACIQLCHTFDGSPGLMIRRPSSLLSGLALEMETSQYQAAIKACRDWTSYLAKTYTKGNTPHWAREYQGSHIPTQKPQPII